jgi:uncharacterized membrane protein YoaK (UPF0700 family)
MLTLVTGLVDAISILALGRVFVANMTGNVVFAGFAIAGPPGFSIAASLFALAGFLTGAHADGARLCPPSLLPTPSEVRLSGDHAAKTGG